MAYNGPPFISGSGTDLGTKSEGFEYTYRVNDLENDDVRVEEMVDNKTLRSYMVTLREDNTLTLSGHDFTALSNAKHTITITATDTGGNTATRTLTFTKLVTDLVVTLAQPLAATALPKRANIIVTRDIPAGGTFKVETTNNPFDPLAKWEDCTKAVLQSVAHVFTNTTNISAQFGMNIRVSVERGTALSPCWISSIQGNFE